MKRQGMDRCPVYLFPCVYHGHHLPLAWASIIQSDWNSVNPIVNWVGLSTSGMFSEPQFIYSFSTLMYTAINVDCQHRRFWHAAGHRQARLRSIYRAGFWPALISGISGLYLEFIKLRCQGALGIAFLRSFFRPDTVIWSDVRVNTWQYTGYIMMIYVASIQSIGQRDGGCQRGREFFPAVAASDPHDGQRLHHHAVPDIDQLLQGFDLNFLTNGGPAMRFMAKPIRSSQLLAMDIYRTANQQNLMAQAQAKAVIFFIVLVIFSLTQVYLNKRKELEA